MFIFLYLLTLIHLWLWFTFIQGQEDHCARDCQDFKDRGLNKSGVYRVTPVGGYKGFDVYCDMETDDGGWLVFQRREDGTVAFFREWEEYELGFGDVFGEHWLGNFALHAITQQGYYELRIELEDMEQESRYAKYRVFRIEHTKELYQLVVSGYSGTAGDAMWPTNMMAFSTKDRDNDAYKDVHCADSFKGGWWYNACHLSNLNGLYLSGNHTSYADGVNWGVWKGLYYSLKKTEMKIRRAL